jgi:hypothetical protein
VGRPRQHAECLVPGCHELSRAKGRCPTCYYFWRRNGRDRVIRRENAEAKLERRLARSYAAEVTRQEHELWRDIYRAAGGR